jgi:hypothetical protein
LAKLTASSTGKQSYIIFVVRDDSSSSDLLFQQSTNTYQAYNPWGGKSLYTFNSSSTPTINSTVAVMVSYNRPYSANYFGTGDFFKWEFNMLAFVESQGYDVTYTTDVDTHASPSLILNHKGFLIVGHDEYWSWEMRQNVTAARDAGVNLGSFSANECFWQIRYQPSDVTGADNRTIVAYKEAASQDPDATNPSTNFLITTQWRLPHGSYPATPEDSLIGQMSIDFEPVVGPNGGGANIAIGNTSNWVFDNSGLQNGDTLPGLLGYEVDAVDSGSPPGTITLTSSPFQVAPDPTTHFADMSLYQANSGAWVFSTGSMDWTFGLSHVSTFSPSPSLVNPAAQQITINVLNQFIGLSLATPMPSVTATATPPAMPTSTPTPIAAPTPRVAAIVRVSRSSLNFGTVKVGRSKAKGVTLVNTAKKKDGATVTFTGGSVSGSSEFSASTSCNGQIGPKGKCSVVVSFAPTSPGPASATAAINGNASNSPQTIGVTGVGR